MRILITVILALNAWALQAEESSEIRTATVTVVTASADDTAAAVLVSAEKLGGRLQSQTGESITVLIPGLSPEDAVLQTLPPGAVILSRQSARKDAGERMAQLRAEIESKRKHLSNLKKLFDETDFSQTLEIETEYLKAVQEMEALLGELNYLKESASYTLLNVRFRLETPRGIVRRPPEFPWMAERGAEQVLGESAE